MINFEQLVEKTEQSKDRVKYIKNFFTVKNFNKYKHPKDTTLKNSIAVGYMFIGQEEITKRCQEVLNFDPYCIEAFYCFYILADSPSLQIKFNEYYEKLGDYPTLEEYQAKNYLDILDLYAEFLTTITNFTKTIEVVKTIKMLTKTHSRKNITRLAFAYGITENDKDFYKLYQEVEFDAFAYILLVLTLLKHDEETKAEEVLVDMFEKVEYATYLDHCWDLDENDKTQNDFGEIVDGLSEQIDSVPLFYSFVNRVREKHGL